MDFVKTRKRQSHLLGGRRSLLRPSRRLTCVDTEGPFKSTSRYVGSPTVGVRGSSQTPLPLRPFPLLWGVADVCPVGFGHADAPNVSLVPLLGSREEGILQGFSIKIPGSRTLWSLYSRYSLEDGFFLQDKIFRRKRSYKYVSERENKPFGANQLIDRWNQNV